MAEDRSDKKKLKQMTILYCYAVHETTMRIFAN